MIFSHALKQSVVSKIKKLILNNQALGFLGFLDKIDPSQAAFTVISIDSKTIEINILVDGHQGTKLGVLLACGWRPVMVALENELDVYLDNGLNLSMNESQFFEESRFEAFLEAVVQDNVVQQIEPIKKTKRQLAIEKMCGVK